MRCQHCGKDIDESQFRSPLTYCPHCGQILKASSSERVAEDIFFCPYCGKELSSRVSFCPHCGEELPKRIPIYHDHHEDSKITEQRVRPMIDTSAQKRRGDKLYKQWAKHSELPTEVIPSTELPREIPARRERKGIRLPSLYLLLGVCIVVLGVGLVLLFTQS